MDHLSALDPCKKVVFMKGSQIGATEAGCNWIGYVIDIAQKSMIVAMPTETMAEKFSKLRLQPMIDQCESLKKKCPSGRDGGNTIMFKEHLSGVVALTGANAASSTKSLPIPYIYLDECDSYPADVEGEGDAVSLFMRAARTFSNSKTFLTSTPTIAGASIIEREFLETNQAYYHVPCTMCGTAQKLDFENLRYVKPVYSAVKYECVHCGYLIEEQEKEQFLPAGDWVSEYPDREDGITWGFHLNSLYAPFGWFSWADIVEMYEKAQGDDPRLKTFTNTVLGKTWAEKSEAPDWQNLFNRREVYTIGTVPQKAAFLTCGVDVQKDRLEAHVIGWAEGRENWSIDYRVFLGDTSSDEVWLNLDKMLNETFIRDDGAEMRLKIMGIDSSYNTSEVYSYCQRHDPTRVIPLRGQDHLASIVSTPRQVHVAKSGKKVGGLKFWNIGVSLMKSELYGWLRNEIAEDGTVPPNYCHFPQYEQSFFRGITAEAIQVKFIKGKAHYEWVKKYARNEPLDTFIYARAAANIVGMDRMLPEHWEEHHGSYFQRSEPVIQKKKSSFWDRSV